MYVNIFFKTIVHETTDQAIKDKESATSALKGLGVRQLATEVDDLAQSLIKDKKLKNSLWRLFLIELEEDARVLTERKLSYLSNTTYEGLAQFDWFYVLEEMLRYQPLLTDVLLAVSTSRKNIQSNDHYNRLLYQYFQRSGSYLWNLNEEMLQRPFWYSTSNGYGSC